eukprot:SAG25_NODE_1637_length_2642_cov_3.620134_4_plen_144_part_00
MTGICLYAACSGHEITEWGNARGRAGWVGWLEDSRVHNQPWWRRECGCSDRVPFGMLDTAEHAQASPGPAASFATVKKTLGTAASRGERMAPSTGPQWSWVEATALSLDALPSRKPYTGGARLRSWREYQPQPPIGTQILDID